MVLADTIIKDCVVCELNSKEKSEIIDELSSNLSSYIEEVSREDVLTSILEREKLGSTGIGYGVAIPHGKVEGISKVYISFGRSTDGVDFDSIDDKPAHLFFLIIAPMDSSALHLKALASISGLLKEEQFRKQLMKAKDSAEIYNIIIEGEKLI